MYNSTKAGFPLFTTKPHSGAMRLSGKDNSVKENPHKCYYISREKNSWPNDSRLKTLISALKLFFMCYLYSYVHLLYILASNDTQMNQQYSYIHQKSDKRFH